MQMKTIKNEVYDTLKWVALIFLPGLASFYFGMDAIWGWWKAPEIVGTITLVDTFLGLLLGISSLQYNADNSPE